MDTDEHDEPRLVVGEAKSFGFGAINDEAIDSLKKVAERLYGTPKSWMSPFMPNGRLVQRITVKQDSSEKVRYERRQRAS
jgi:hypothetical protein